jgi:hypothetical protein
MRIISYSVNNNAPFENHNNIAPDKSHDFYQVQGFVPVQGFAPEKASNSMRIKDEQFMNIQQLIDSKRKFLYEKQKSLNSVKQQNTFLTGVKNDYSKYNQYIMDQKNEQIKAFQLLNNYITDLTNSGGLSQRNLEDAEMEQQKIMKEVDAIKKNLDTLIDETNKLK